MKSIISVSSALLAIATVGPAVAQELPVKTTVYQLFDDSLDTAAADAVYRIERTKIAGRSQLDSVFYVASNRLLKVKNTAWQPTGDTLTVMEGWRANGRLQ